MARSADSVLEVGDRSAKEAYSNIDTGMVGYNEGTDYPNSLTEFPCGEGAPVKHKNGELNQQCGSVL